MEGLTNLNDAEHHEKRRKHSLKKKKQKHQELAENVGVLSLSTLEASTFSEFEILEPRKKKHKLDKRVNMSETQDPSDQINEVSAAEKCSSKKKKREQEQSDSQIHSFLMPQDKEKNHEDLSSRLGDSNIPTLEMADHPLSEASKKKRKKIKKHENEEFEKLNPENENRSEDNVENVSQPEQISNENVFKKKKKRKKRKNDCDEEECNDVNRSSINNSTTGDPFKNDSVMENDLFVRETGSFSNDLNYHNDPSLNKKKHKHRENYENPNWNILDIVSNSDNNSAVKPTETQSSKIEFSKQAPTTENAQSLKKKRKKHSPPEAAQMDNNENAVEGEIVTQTEEKTQKKKKKHKNKDQGTNSLIGLDAVECTENLQKQTLNSDEIEPGLAVLKDSTKKRFSKGKHKKKKREGVEKARLSDNGNSHKKKQKHSKSSHKKKQKAYEGISRFNTFYSDNLQNWNMEEEVVDFEVPRLHSSENVKPLSNDDKEQLKAEGVKIRTGSWSKSENYQLIKNWLDFSKHFNVKDPYLLLGIVNCGENISQVKEFIAAKHFYVRLAKGIDRPLFCVYKKARALLHPYKAKGKLSVKHVEELKEQHSKYGNHWCRISEALERPPDQCESAYRNHKEGRNLGFWSKEEERLLRKAVKKYTKNQDKLPSKSQKIPWKKVSKKVVTRNEFQCREHWFNSKSLRKESKNYEKWKDKDYACLIYILYTNKASDESFIDWQSIHSYFSRCLPSYKPLAKKWWNLKQRVPSYKLKSYEQIVSWLYDVHLPHLLEKMGFPMDHLKKWLQNRGFHTDTSNT